jgi:hypothetical protein
MKNLHNFHVLFWLKKTSVKRDETIPIYARIKVDGIPADISTKERPTGIPICKQYKKN